MIEAEIKELGGPVDSVVRLIITSRKAVEYFIFVKYFCLDLDNQDQWFRSTRLPALYPFNRTIPRSIYM